MGRPDLVQAAVFDFDGTLCDTEIKNLQLVQGVLRQMGAEVSMAELESLTGGDDRVTVPPILERHGAAGTIDDYERLRDNCYKTYSEADLVPEPGAVELLEDLRARGLRLAVASMTVTRSIVTALNRLGLLHYFDAVVCGDMVTHKKPDPEPYLRALELVGVVPEHAVAFEDSTTGIASAKAAGIYTFAYTGGSIAQDVSAADEVVRSFEGFSL